jgi:hypothetical protein
MKKFTTLNEEVKPKYEIKDSLRNEIYSLIESSLSIKITNEDSLDKDININGKDELVEKIKTLIDDVRIKERTFTLETVKTNVYRNFDMKWLNEQIAGLNKIKVGSDFVLAENIQDGNIANQDKAKILQYFAKQLYQSKTFENSDYKYKFSYDPADGIFKFINKEEGVVVYATPFFNDDHGIQVEVFSDDDLQKRKYFKMLNFNIEQILFEGYEGIMYDFLVNGIEDWLDDVNPQTDEEEVIYPESEKSSEPIEDDFNERGFHNYPKNR